MVPNLLNIFYYAYKFRKNPKLWEARKKEFRESLVIAGILSLVVMLIK